jgi:eukaryotic-like serine/threonine-protein kinase
MTASRLTHSKSKSPSEVRLVEVLDAYLAAAQEGTAPAREVLLGEHPELAEDLEACLASLEFIRQASLTAPPLVADEQGVDASEGEAGIGDLGDFRLIAEVGRGGMGVVYEAVQLSLNRRVALKVLPFAAAMDPIQLRRFQTEALAAAQLHHTHIVPVYSVGCERGVHYYAMQFIEGQTLAQAIAARRQLQQPPPATHASPAAIPGASESLPLESRLQVESGPAEAGTPTSPGSGCPDLSGTPDRRSPVTTEPPTLRYPTGPAQSSRTREYCRTAAALGIQAAEALDHAHKFGILHRDIKPANLLLDDEGNLWITDFGLARLQDDTGLTMTGDMVGTLRYMSPEQALAKRGYLDHRTDIYSLGATLYDFVTLRPAIDGQDRQEILRKIAQEEPIAPRRHNPAMPRELETILLKAMNKEPESRYSTAQELADDLERFLEHKPIKARRPMLLERATKWSRRHRMVVASAFLFLLLGVLTLAVSTVLIARQRRAAEEQRDEARQAVDAMYTEVAEQWLAQQPALEPVQRTFLQKALDYYQRFAGEHSTDPKVRFKTAQAFHRVGMIQYKLSRFEEAEAAYRREMAILERLVSDLPFEKQYRVGLAVGLQELGGVLRETGRRAEAEQPFRRAIALQERLVAESPSEPECLNDLARSQSGLALVLWDTKRWDEAERTWRQTIALQERLVAESPDVVKYRQGLARSHNNFGTFKRGPGSYAESQRSLVRAIALWAKLAADAPSMPLYRHFLAISHSNLGLTLEASGHPGEAVEAYRQSVAYHEKVVADSPSVSQYRHSLFKSYGNMGTVLRDSGRLDEAENAYRHAVAHQEKVVAGSPSVVEYRDDLASGYGNLGSILTEMGRWANAEEPFHRAIAVWEKLSPDSSFVPRFGTSLAWGRRDLGDVLMMTGRPAEAEPAYRQAIALFERVDQASSVPDHQKNGLVSSVARLATLFEVEGRKVEAEQEYRRAVAMAEKLTNPEAQNDLSRALAISPNRLQDDHRVALQLAKKTVKESPQDHNYWATLGIAQYRTGDAKAAIESIEKSMQLHTGGDAKIWFFLAMAKFRNGQNDQARQWYYKAVEVMEKNRSQDYELPRFRAEASAVLGLTDRPSSPAKTEENATRQSKP